MVENNMLFGFRDFKNGIPSFIFSFNNKKYIFICINL